MAKVLSVNLSAGHSFSKAPAEKIVLAAGEGVCGDAHKGITVRHRSRVRQDPSQPNLRQVHLVHMELLEELESSGFKIGPGNIGENITTSGLNILALPTDAILSVGGEVKLRVTGLRNPCAQFDNYQKGLTAAVLDRDENGELIRKAGIMAIVLAGGTIYPEDPIAVQYPDGPHRPLVPV